MSGGRRGGEGEGWGTNLHGLGVEEVGVRDLDVELDVEVAALTGVGAIGHAGVLENLDVAVGDDLTVGVGGDRHVLAVGELEVEGETAQRFGEGDLPLGEEVDAAALELSVGLLGHDDDHVAGRRSGGLVGGIAEDDVLAVLHAWLDFDLEALGLGDDLAAIAGLATVRLGDDLALTTALAADLLGLGHHTGAELNDLHLRRCEGNERMG